MTAQCRREGDTTERILDALHLFPGKAAAATAAASSDGVSGGMNDLEKKKLLGMILTQNLPSRGHSSRTH